MIADNMITKCSLEIVHVYRVVQFLRSDVCGCSRGIFILAGRHSCKFFKCLVECGLGIKAYGVGDFQDCPLFVVVIAEEASALIDSVLVDEVVETLIKGFVDDLGKIIHRNR